MSTKLKTPVEGFSGVVAGVTFVNGEGETDDPSVLPYFERHGYTVAAEKKAAPAADKKTPAPKASEKKAAPAADPAAPAA
jgi:hypothetical protein